MEQLTKMFDTFPESCGDGAVTAVGFMLNSSVLCWQFVSEVGTSCTIQYSKISQVLHFDQKLEDVK